jgi:hypothetical protein
MSGALEEFWFPVLEMNCGCPEPEEPETAIFFCFFPFLQPTLNTNLSVNQNQTTGVQSKRTFNMQAKKIE